MREIKLRYVFKRKSDGHIHQIIAPIECLEQDFSELRAMLRNEAWEIVSRDQFTGLRDKNGVEVYEGDVLVLKECIGRGDYSYDDAVVRACWSDSELAYVITGANYYNLACALTEYEFSVIGNVHQNPELLQGEKCEKHT